MRPHIFFFVLVLFSISLVHASTFPTDTNINFKIPTNLSGCNLTVSQEDTTNIISSSLMGDQAGFANYTINQSLLSVGEYNYFSECGAGEFAITRTGKRADTNLEIFIWILFILSIIGNFGILILILVKLATSTETIFGVLYAWGFYTLLLIVNYLSGMLTTSYISSSTDLFLTILVWSNGVLPVISLVITMFIKGTQKKKPIGINELTGRAPGGLR